MPTNSLPTQKFPSEFSTLTLASDDTMIVSDTSNTDKDLGKTTIAALGVAAMGANDTGDLPEGSNLYYTTARAQADNKWDYTAVAINTTITSSDHLKLYDVDCSGGNRIMTLPSAATVGEGFRVGIRKESASNSLTINPDGSDTVNGGASQVLNSDKDFVALVSDGVSDWVKESQSATSLGDVAGPGSAVDDNIATFDGTTGKIIQDSGISVETIFSDSATKVPTSSAISAYVGTESFTAGENITENDAVYVDSATGDVYKCDASDTAKLNFFGFAVSTETATNPVRVKFSGIKDSFSSLTADATYFLSNTAGAIATTPGDNAVIAGFALTATTVKVVQSDYKFFNEHKMSSVLSTFVYNKSGATNYAHGLGTVPRFIKFEAKTLTATGPNVMGCSGSRDGTNNQCVYYYNNSLTGTPSMLPGSNSSYCIRQQYHTTGAGFDSQVYASVTSVDATNFTLTWVSNDASGPNFTGTNQLEATVYA